MIKDCLSAGLEPLASEYPTALQWELPLWTLYHQQLACQYRQGPTGPAGLDYGVWLPVIQSHGWHLDTALTLLHHMETALLAPAEITHPGGAHDTLH